MIKRNYSLYFDNVEQYIALHPDHAPLAMLMAAVRSNGCPEEDIDSVVNGAIAQVINLSVTPPELSVTISKDGQDYPQMAPYNPTYEELIADVVVRFDDLGYDRAKGIVDALIRKQALSVYPDEKVYRTMVLVPRQILSL